MSKENYSQVTEHVNDKVTADYIRSIFDYDPDTGELIWKYNANKRANWNTRYAGTSVGGLDAHGYLHCSITFNNNKYYYKVHRLIWLYVTGKWPKEQIDHINNDKTDNRIANLREATCIQNNCNKPGRTKYKGVTFNGWSYVAKIGYSGKYFYIGSYNTPEEAHEAYKIRAKQLHKEFVQV